MNHYQIGQIIQAIDRAALPEGVTLYSFLKSWGVPEGSIHNGRLAARFLDSFVSPGLLTEERAAEILTARIARQTHRLLTGRTESRIRMTAGDLATVLAADSRASIGATLDSLARYGQQPAEASRTARAGISWLRNFLSLSLPQPLAA
jgi:hypothetical protein